MNLILFNKNGFVDLQNLIVGLIFRQDSLFKKEDILRLVKWTLDSTEEYLNALKDGGVSPNVDEDIRFLVDTTLDFQKMNDTKSIRKLLEKNFTADRKEQMLRQSNEFVTYSLNVFMQSHQVTYHKDGQYYCS